MTTTIDQIFALIAQKHLFIETRGNTQLRPP